MWRGGCIIRSKFLGNIKEAFDKNPELENLLFDPYFVGKMQATHVSNIEKLDRIPAKYFIFKSLSYNTKRLILML